MSREVSFSASFTGEDAVQLFRAIAKEPAFGFDDSGRWKLDGDAHKVGADWRDTIPTRVKEGALGRFGAGTSEKVLIFDSLTAVKVRVPWELDVAKLVALVARLPCTLVAVSGIYPEWSTDAALKLPNKVFGYAHYPYQSFAAFKGDVGHARLVSRRWLTQGGPWVLHRGPNDTSLLQLHDLDADAKTANQQVRRCQDRLGPSDDGGYIAPGLTRKCAFELQHSERDRKASIVIAPKRAVTPREMLEAAALRGSNLAGPDRHIDSVAFVYIDEPEARRDLHDLWLHGIECWTYIDGRETRIDTSYEPPAPPRPW